MSETELRSVFDTAEPRLLITEPEFEHLAPRQGVPALVLDCAGPSDSHEAALAAASEVLPDCAPTRNDACLVNVSWPIVLPTRTSDCRPEKFFFSLMSITPVTASEP